MEGMLRAKYGEGEAFQDLSGNTALLTVLSGFYGAVITQALLITLLAMDIFENENGILLVK